MHPPRFSFEQLVLGGLAAFALLVGAGMLVAPFLLPNPGERSRQIFFLIATVTPSVLLALIAIAFLADRRRETTRLHQRLATQFAVTRILSDASSLEESIPLILKTIGQGIECDVGEMWQVDPTAGVLRWVAAWYLPALDMAPFEEISRQTTFSPGHGLPGRVWATGRFAMMRDVVTDPEFVRPAAAAKAGLHGALAFPIGSGSQVLGVLVFFSKRARLPDAGLLELLSDIGSQVGHYAERKQAEEALTQERDLLGALMHNVPDGIYFKDAQSRFLRINGAVAERFGLKDPAQAIGKSDRDFFTEEFARQTRLDEETVLRQGQPLLGKEEKEIWPDGRETWASTTTMPLRSPRGEIIGIFGITRDITARRQAEEALRQAETKYRGIFENAVEGIYQTSVSGQFLTANPMLAKIYGFTSPVELLACRDLYANHLYVEPGRRAEFMRLMQMHGSLTGFDSEISRRDGSRVWISENARSLCDDAGKVLGYEGTVVDITERKHGEEALRATNDTLRAIIQASPLAIFTLNLEGIVRSWNTAAAGMFGWSEAEVLHRPTPLVPPGKEGEYQGLLERLRSGDAFAGVQAQRQRKDGSLIDVSLSAAPLYDAAAQVNGVMVVVADITNIKRAEQALIQERALLRGLIDSIPDLIFYKDQQGRYLGCNAAFEKYLGRREKEIVGLSAQELFPRAVGDAYREKDRRVLETGQPDCLEEWLDYPDSRRVLHEVVKTPFFGPSGQVLGLIGISRDITERKRVEEQLRHAQKMEAIGQLAGGVAHDFNNLLTAVLGNVALLLGGSSPSDPNRELLRDIDRAAMRAADLTRQLLGFSRQTMLRLQPTNLNAAIDETTGIVRRTIDPRITVEVQLTPNLWPVLADPGQMNQVLMNLVLNARDAMPEGGRLILETCNLVLDADLARLQHLEARPGEFVRVRVRDTGHGIPPEIRPRIFDPFFTTKEPGKGTGLGLAMVFGIVKQHQGWVECYSEVGRGTDFDIYLPQAMAGVVAEGIPPSPAAPTPANSGGSETILLVDDEAVIRNLGRTILQRQGYQVLLAEDGAEAVKFFQREHGRIDLVILDLMMPRLSGRDTLRRLLEIDPQVRVLFSSGYSAEQVTESDKDGVLGFVNKPYRPHELVHTVRRALDQARSVVSASLGR